MMKNNWKGLRLITKGVIIAMLLCFIFLSDPWDQKAATVLSIIWLFSAMFSVAYYSFPKHITERISKLIMANKEKPQIMESPERALLRQVNIRITEKLRTLYPAVTWDWDTKPTLKFLLDGGVGRIRLENAEDYNFAEITMDYMGKINWLLLKAVPLEDAVHEETGAETVSDYTADVETWYQSKFEKPLLEVVADLNSRHIKKFTLDENGELFTLENGEKKVQASIDRMLDLESWKQLVELLENIGLKAVIKEKQLFVSWDAAA